MEMFNIAICDDDIILCTQLENYLSRYVNKGIVTSEIFYSADSLYEALSRGEHYDLIFLDIEFKFSSGVEIGRKIRHDLGDEKIQIVYVSSKQSYAMDLFTIRPMNFLVKPLSEEDVTSNVEKAIALAEMYESHFEFKFGMDNYRIPYGSIMYFESSNRKIYIRTKHGTKEMYGKLNEIEAVAPPNFIRIHQSYLVNRIYVTHWNQEEIEMGEDCRLPVSQTYRKSMCKAIMRNERG